MRMFLRELWIASQKEEGELEDLTWMDQLIVGGYEETKSKELVGSCQDRVAWR
jgi:hypothetical protein